MANRIAYIRGQQPIGKKITTYWSSLVLGFAVGECSSFPFRKFPWGEGPPSTEWSDCMYFSGLAGTYRTDPTPRSCGLGAMLGVENQLCHQHQLGGCNPETYNPGAFGGYGKDTMYIREQLVRAPSTYYHWLKSSLAIEKRTT
jgi:hypothetical protein